MNVRRSLWLALPFAFLLPLGCNTAAETGEAGATAEAAPAAVAAPAAATQGLRRRHARGPAHMLLHAARALDLEDAQRTTIDNLSAQLRGAGTSASNGHQAISAALAAGVRAGNVDLSVIEPLQVAAGAARQARAQRQTAALNGLWAALEPEQRQALVANVRARAASWASHRQDRQPAGGWAQQRLARLTNQLGLDASQQEAVAGLMASNRPTPAAMQALHVEMQNRHEALLTAFEGDAFDASTLDLTAPLAAKLGPAQHAQFLAQLVPILQADQRETLAESMETAQN
jgi:hypothetical protein